MKLGARLYKDRCSDCHQPGGEGVPRAYPSFAGNAALLMRNPVNAIRITLNGGFPPMELSNMSNTALGDSWLVARGA